MHVMHYISHVLSVLSPNGKWFSLILSEPAYPTVPKIRFRTSHWGEESLDILHALYNCADMSGEMTWFSKSDIIYIDCFHIFIDV